MVKKILEFDYFSHFFRILSLGLDKIKIFSKVVMPYNDINDPFVMTYAMRDLLAIDPEVFTGTVLMSVFVFTFCWT